MEAVIWNGDQGYNPAVLEAAAQAAPTAPSSDRSDRKAHSSTTILPAFSDRFLEINLSMLVVCVLGIFFMPDLMGQFEAQRALDF